MAGLIRAALVVLAFAAATAPAKANDWLPVSLTLDIEAGALVGTAGGAPIRIERPPLGQDMRGAFNGYIDPEHGAFIPEDAGWLPRLPAGFQGWRVEVSAPAGFVPAPFPGGLVEQTPDGAVARFDLPDLPGASPLVIGPFEVSERQFGEITVRTFFTAANADHADAYLEAAGAAIAAMSAKIGAYPYPAFSVVESPLPVGLGYLGYTLVSGRIIPLPFMRGRSLWHEISHVWWGNGVFVDYDAGNWAEGFAVYFADYELAKRRGPDAAREMRFDWLLEFDAVPPARRYPLRQFVTKTHGQAQAIGYGKAAMTLEMLRLEIGDAAFDAGVRRFWTDNRFKTAGWAEVEAAFEAASGKDLSAFFTRWLDDPGAAPADVTDRDYLTFRALAPEERIPTLRLLLSAEALTPVFLANAPPEQAMLEGAILRVGPTGEDGLPVMIGDRKDLAARVRETPPGDGPAIWAGTTPDGTDAIAVAADNAMQAAALLARVRHYGRYSYLVPQRDARPLRGRWLK